MKSGRHRLSAHVVCVTRGQSDVSAFADPDSCGIGAGEIGGNSQSVGLLPP